MSRREFHIGPGATSLILVMVVLCMSALGVLGLVNARSDLRLSQRSITVAEGVSALYDQSERSLAALDAVVAKWQASGADEAALRDSLPANMTLEGDLVSWEETSALGQTLQCSARLQKTGQSPRLTWAQHAVITEAGRNGMEDDEWN